MTVTTLENNAVYTGDGTTTVFPFTYRCDDIAWLEVWQNGQLVSVSEYDAVLNPDQANTPGGTVTFNTAPALNDSLSILRVVILDQNTDYPPYGPFPSQSHEAALDKLTLATQQFEEKLDRSVVPPPDTPPLDDYALPPYEATKALKWDAVDAKLINSTYDPDQSATEAAASAAAAAASEANAAASEAVSIDNAGYAQEWAINPEDVPVSVDAGGNGLTTFSALHWAAKAEGGGWGDTTPVLGGDHTATGAWDFTGSLTKDGNVVWQEATATLAGDHTTTGGWTFSGAGEGGITVKDSDVVSDTEDRSFFGQVGTASGISTVGSSGNPNTFWLEFYRTGTTPTSVVIMGDGGGPLGIGTRALNSKDALQVNGSVSALTRVVFDSGTARTLDVNDNGTIIRFANNSAVTVTVPDSLPAGFSCIVRNNLPGTLILTGSDVTIDGKASVVVDNSKRYTTLIKEVAGKFFTAGNVT